jgi:hypothetical protein
MARQEGLVAAARTAAGLGADVPARGALGGQGRWFIEVGAGAAFMVSGNFMDDPHNLRVSQPSIAWHWVKSASEKYWFYKWW